MLKLTPNAAATLTAARADSGTPDTFGVRFFTSNSPSSDRPGFAMEFVALPEPGDASLQEHGLKVYVAPQGQSDRRRSDGRRRDRRRASLGSGPGSCARSRYNRA